MQPTSRNGESTLRWFVVGIVVLSSALNYLDRMVLAALAPTIQAHFHVHAREYGYLLSAFSLVYALSSPIAGLLVDRIGLAGGMALAVGLWSLAGTATGLATSFGALLACRAALGFGEAGGVPATGKAFATYLAPKDRAMGTALNQVGLTIGASAAPLLTAWCIEHYDWRAAFIAAGIAGLLWIPLWLWAARLVPPAAITVSAVRVTAGTMIRDPRLISLVLASMISMTVYSLWTNWTTVFLVTRHALSAADANRTYAWIPPIAATLGGLTGGWLPQQLIRRGLGLRQARLRSSILGGAIVPLMAFAPLAPTPGLATAAICAGFFGVTCQSVNYYAVPLDTFGPARAAFAVSALTGSFGLMQTIVSPLIGVWSERFGWNAICYIVAVLPLFSVLLLRRSLQGSK